METPDFGQGMLVLAVNRLRSTGEQESSEDEDSDGSGSNSDFSSDDDTSEVSDLDKFEEA